MCPVDNDKKLTEILDEIKERYISQKKPNFKSLAEEFEFDYDELRKIAKRENWTQYRTNGGCLATSNCNGKAVNNARTDEKAELETLRRTAFDLANNAAESVAGTENFSPKDFDLLVGTYVKIIGAQAKIAGLEDGIDRLISELTQQDDFLQLSGQKEGSDDV